MFAPVFVFGAICLISIVLREWFANRRLYFLGQKIPGPKALPLVGNFHIFAKFGFGADLLGIFKIMSEYDGLARFWLGRSLTVAISDPKYMEVAFTDPGALGRAQQYKPIEYWLGKGNAVTSVGDQWRKSRKLTVQTFTAIPPNHTISHMIHETDVLVENLKKHVGGGFLEWATVLRRTGTAGILRVALDEEPSAELEQTIADVDELARISMMKCISPLHYFDAVFRWTKDGIVYEKLSRNMTDVIRRVVLRKKGEYEEMKKQGVTPPNAVIFNIFEKYPDETLEEIMAHMLTIIVVGLDSTVTTLGFILLVLGILPDIQNKLVQEDLEIQNSLDSDELTPSILPKYAYLDRVIKETMRLYPTFPVSGRSCVAEVQMGEYLLPKGCNLLPMQMWTHRCADVFPDPLKFDPDRFLPENTKDLHPYAFAPFGGGNRKCPGAKYAMMDMKIVLTKLLREYRVISEYKTLEELDENLMADIVLRDKKRNRIRLEDRHSVKTDRVSD